MKMKYLMPKAVLTACYAIIFLLLPSINKAAGTAPKLLKINYENTSGERAVTRFMYDSKGIVYRARWEMTDKSKSSVNFYQHNEAGRLISVYRDFSNGVRSYELYNYDSLGNRSSEYFYRSDTLSGYADYEYKNNRLLRAVCHHYKGWLDGEIYYNHDSSGRLAAAMIRDKDRPLGSITYTYDQSGNLVRETWQMYGWWSQTFNYIYGNLPDQDLQQTDPLIRIEPGYRILRENRNYNFESGGLSVYTYDDKGCLLKKTFTGSDGVTIETIYKNDKPGRAIESIEAGSDGSLKKFKYTYDDSGRIIYRVLAEPGPVMEFESYLYDSFGRLARAYVSNYTSLGITGYINFTYDDFDRLQKGFFTSVNGERADIFITYNNENAPMEILWNFYSGKFHKCTYEYEPVN